MFAQTFIFLFLSGSSKAANGQAKLLRCFGVYVVYQWFSLRQLLAKTQDTVYHLRNHEANGELRVTWRGHELEHTGTPKYRGVQLDCALHFKKCDTIDK